MYMHMRTSENIVLQALMDEHQENRDLQNITAEILNREKARIFFTFLHVHTFLITLILFCRKNALKL